MTFSWFKWVDSMLVFICFQLVLYLMMVHWVLFFLIFWWRRLLVITFFNFNRTKSPRQSWTSRSILYCSFEGSNYFKIYRNNKNAGNRSFVLEIARSLSILFILDILVKLLPAWIFAATDSIALDVGKGHVYFRVF